MSAGTNLLVVYKAVASILPLSFTAAETPGYPAT